MVPHFFRCLLTRVNKSLLRIPRKGRIRFCLALLIAVTGFKITGALRASSCGLPAARPAEITDVVSGNDTKKGSAFDCNAKLSPFTQCQLRLTFDRDTFKLKGDSVAVCYSLDTALQKFINRLLKQYRPRYGAAVVMDPQSGRVLAMVSYRHDSVPDIGERLFLRNVFPAASIYKTITAAAAIETGGYTAETIVPVAGRNHTLYRFQIKKEIKPWSEITVKDAYAYSINPAFARIGMYVVGKETFGEYNRRFGFNTTIPFELATDSSIVIAPDDTSYAMAEVASGFNTKTRLSPLHGALIAAAVSEEGRMPAPHIVDSICRVSDGRCLYRMKPSVWKTPIGSAAACELQTMMNRVVEVGTCRKSFRVVRGCAWCADLEYGGKTGSLDVDSLGKVDWFIGFAVNRNVPDQRLAVAIVTVHGRFWTVHSSFIGAEIFRKSFCPAPREHLAKMRGGRIPSVSAPVVGKPKG
jgi:peptidoglycan glycosyltransferase